MPESGWIFEILKVDIFCDFCQFCSKCCMRKGQWGLVSFMKASTLNSAVLSFDAVSILGTFKNSSNENRKVKKKEKRKRMMLCSIKVPHMYIYIIIWTTSTQFYTWSMQSLKKKCENSNAFFSWPGWKVGGKSNGTLGQGLGKFWNFMSMVNIQSAKMGLNFIFFLYLLFGGQKMDPEREMLNVLNFRLQCSNCMYNWAVTWSGKMALSFVKVWEFWSKNSCTSPDDGLHQPTLWERCAPCSYSRTCPRLRAQWPWTPACWPGVRTQWSLLPPVQGALSPPSPWSVPRTPVRDR